MKQALVALTLIAAVVGGWFWYTRPKPVAAPTRRLAPPGVFFLTQRVSATTDSGVLSFAEGTPVRQIAETSGDKLRVQADNTELDIEKAKLTNDLDVASTASRRDATARKRFDDWQRLQQAGAAQRRQQEAEAVARGEAWRKAHAPPPLGASPNPLDRGPYDRK